MILSPNMNPAWLPALQLWNLLSFKFFGCSSAIHNTWVKFNKVLSLTNIVSENDSVTIIRVMIWLENPAFPHYVPLPDWSLLMDASQWGYWVESNYCVWSWFSLSESLICLSTLVTCCPMWPKIIITFLSQLLGCSFISLLIPFHMYILLLYVARIWCWILCYISNHKMLWQSRLHGWLRGGYLIWSLHLVLVVLSVCRTYTLLHLCGLQYISDC